MYLFSRYIFVHIIFLTIVLAGHMATAELKEPPAEETTVVHLTDYLTNQSENVQITFPGGRTKEVHILALPASLSKTETIILEHTKVDSVEEARPSKISQVMTPLPPSVKHVYFRGEGMTESVIHSFIEQIGHTGRVVVGVELDNSSPANKAVVVPAPVIEKIEETKEPHKSVLIIEENLAHPTAAPSSGEVVPDSNPSSDQQNSDNSNSNNSSDPSSQNQHHSYQHGHDHDRDGPGGWWWGRLAGERGPRWHNPQERFFLGHHDHDHDSRGHSYGPGWHDSSSSRFGGHDRDRDSRGSRDRDMRGFSSRGSDHDRPGSRNRGVERHGHERSRGHESHEHEHEERARDNERGSRRGH